MKESKSAGQMMSEQGPLFWKGFIKISKIFNALITQVFTLRRCTDDHESRLWVFFPNKVHGTAAHGPILSPIIGGNKKEILAARISVKARYLDRAEDAY